MGNRISHRLLWLKYLGNEGFVGKNDLVSKVYPVCLWELTPEEKDLSLSKPSEWVRIK